MELIETCDERTIAYLSTITIDKYKENYKICNPDQKIKKNEIDFKSQHSILQSFCKTNQKTNCVTKRIYSYSNKTPKELSSGRLYSGGSIQTLPSVYRSLLMRDSTTDIDCVNCAPSILRYICKINNIACPQLEYYTNNRDDILKKFENRTVGKLAYICSTNTDKITRKTGMSDHFKNYDKEMKSIQKELIKIEKYKEILELVSFDKNNFNGCAVNRIICHYENIILQNMIHEINRQGIEIAVLCFDGLLIYGDKYEDNQLLSDVQNYVNLMMPDLNMKLAYKNNNDILFVPDEFDENTPLSNEREFVQSDLEATQKLFSLYPHWKYCLGNLYVFDSGMWSTDVSIMRKIISSFKNVLWKSVFDKETGKYRACPEKSYGNTSDLKNKILIEMPSLCTDNDWIKRTENSSLGMLLFKNGYLDFKNSQFYKYPDHSYNPNIVFTYTMPHDYEEETDGGIYRDSIEKRLFYDPLGKEVGDWFIYNLSRGLAGDVMKKCLFALGFGNTGKSTLSRALLMSLGGYCDSFNANNLQYKQTGQDMAQQNRWIMLKKNKRIIISNEINSISALNGNAIKSLSSGGDVLEGRDHNKSETTFKVEFLTLICANDLPKIKPYDDALDNRIRVVSYTKEYVENPQNDTIELLADKNINDEIDSVQFQKTFVQLLIKKYMHGKDTGAYDDDPQGVVQAKDDWIGADVTVLDKFFEDFEITQNIGDYVSSQEIDNWLTEKKLGITMRRFSMDMKKFVIKNKLIFVNNIQKKKNSKNIHVWTGLKLVQSIPNEFIADPSDDM